VKRGWENGVRIRDWVEGLQVVGKVVAGEDWGSVRWLRGIGGKAVVLGRGMGLIFPQAMPRTLLIFHNMGLISIFYQHP
jgi:hypothetical protein